METAVPEVTPPPVAPYRWAVSGGATILNQKSNLSSTDKMSFSASASPVTVIELTAVVQQPT